MYQNVNNLYGYAMSRFEDVSLFGEGFIENYNEDSNTRYFLEVDVKYAEQLLKLHNDLLFL